MVVMVVVLSRVGCPDCADRQKLERTQNLSVGRPVFPFSFCFRFVATPTVANIQDAADDPDMGHHSLN